MSMYPRAAVILGFPATGKALQDDRFEDDLIFDVYNQPFFGRVIITIDDQSYPTPMDSINAPKWTYDELHALKDKLCESYPEYSDEKIIKWIIFQYD